MKRHFDGKTVVAFDDGSLKEEMKARSSAILAFHLNLAINPNALQLRQTIGLSRVTLILFT